MKADTIKDGFGVTLTFAVGDLSLVLDPISITPPGIDGGDPIDGTTHSNEEYRTKIARSLKEITDISFTAAYDPSAWDTMMSNLNNNGLITVGFPGTDFGTIAIYGYLKNVTPNALVEGEMPTAECTVVVTNDNDGVEAGPTATPA